MQQVKLFISTPDWIISTPDRVIPTPKWTISKLAWLPFSQQFIHVVGWGAIGITWAYVLIWWLLADFAKVLIWKVG